MNLRPFVDLWVEQQRRNPHVVLQRKLVAWEDLDIWTRDDPPKLAPLVPNAVQQSLLTDVCTAYKCPIKEPWKLKGARVNVLKARQQGCSTFWLALWYQMFYNLDFSQTVVITHRQESSNLLWQRVQLWERRARRRIYLPKLLYSNRRELVRQDTGSTMFIGTAGKDDLTRSGLITNVHKTETAFWPTGSDNQISAMLGTLPDWANIVEESTANGIGDHKDRYEQQAAGSATRTYFFPWSMTPEYHSPIPRGFERTEEEQFLAGEYCLCDEQLAWRRKKLGEFRDAGEETLFYQEFPLTPKQAFMASATGAYYDIEYLDALMAEMKDRPPLRVIEPGGPEGMGGIYELFEEPVPREFYVVAADCSEGHDTDDDHDFHTADVFRLGTREQVCSGWGQHDPQWFATDLAALSAFYNNAIVIPERNQSGFEVIGKLRDEGANLYSHVPPGKTDAPEHTRLGYPTTQATKAMRDNKMQSAIARAARAWREAKGTLKPSAAAASVDAPVLHGTRAINELVHYSYLANRRRGGKGAHDDHNTSLTIGYAYIDEYVPAHPRTRSTRPPTRPQYGHHWRRDGATDR